MRTTSARRLSRMENALGAKRRVHYFFWKLDETEEQLRARIQAKIASGEAMANDQFVTFTWTRPDGAETKSDE